MNNSNAHSFTGQLKWRWFQTKHVLEDMVKYDSASRCPLGALSLLWTLGLRHSLASLGALIIVLVLAVYPFAQQVVRYHGCSMPVENQVATIPRTNSFESGGDAPIDEQLQTAMIAVIFSPGQMVTTTCLSGNCTFNKPYSTVGYCGGCEDITPSLTVEFHTYYSESLGQNISFRSLSLPSGIFVDYKPVSEDDVFATMKPINHGPDDLLEANDVRKVLRTTTEIIVAETFPALSHSAAFNDTCRGRNSSWSCLGYGAASCSLYPCVRDYAGAILQGDFEESLVSKSDETVWQISGYQADDGVHSILATIHTRCITKEEKDLLVAIGYSVDDRARWLPFNITSDPNGPNLSFPSSILEHGCMYVVNWGLPPNLGKLSSFFNGTVSGGIAYDTLAHPYLYTSDSSLGLAAIFNYGNVTIDRVDEIFRNTSDSLTTFVRQTANNHNRPAQGAVNRYDTCVGIRWEWLVLPRVLVFASTIFFVAIVIQTRPTGHRVEIWKSSPLALVFYATLDPKLLWKDAEVGDIKYMERAAKRISVKLKQSEDGLMLVHAHRKW